MPLGRSRYLMLVVVPVVVERVAAVVAPVADILAVPVAVLIALAIVAADRLF